MPMPALAPELRPDDGGIDGVEVDVDVGGVFEIGCSDVVDGARALDGVAAAAATVKMTG